MNQQQDEHVQPERGARTLEPKHGEKFTRLILGYRHIRLLLRFHLHWTSWMFMHHSVNDGAGYQC